MTPGNRRPLASRDKPWAQRLATRLAATSITPNQVSMFSMVMALIGGVSFWLANSEGSFTRAFFLIIAIIGCQGRLLCNLLDGMIAVESGKGSPTGPLWNEVPDRVSDTLILVGAGLAVGNATLGWAAASLAIFTAYVRAFSDSLGHVGDFGGPMAKPHRMAILTGCTVLSIVSLLWGWRDQFLLLALWVIVFGSALTTLLRTRRLYAYLQQRPKRRQ